MNKNSCYLFVYWLLGCLFQSHIALGQQQDFNKKVDRYSQLINADLKTKITTDEQFNNNPDNFSFYVANRIEKTNKEFNDDDFYNESVYRLKKLQIPDT